MAARRGAMPEAPTPMSSSRRPDSIALCSPMSGANRDENLQHMPHHGQGPASTACVRIMRFSSSLKTRIASTLVVLSSLIVVW